MIGISNDENNFPYKLLLTNTQVSKICKAFANGSSVNIKLSKTQLRKIAQSGGFLGRLLGLLLKTGLSLIGNVLKPLAKGVLIPLELTAATSATDATIIKKMFGSGFTTLIRGCSIITSRKRGGWFFPFFVTQRDGKKEGVGGTF